MPIRRPSRRIGSPIALLAALAIGAGGASSSWTGQLPAGRTADAEAAPPAIYLEHAELVALRAQSGGQAVAALEAPLDSRHGSSVVAIGVASALPGLGGGLRAAVQVPDLRSHPGSPGTYSGRNHVWIPSLGIDRPVVLFECTRTRAPDNYMYRWGCAGRNNVYLLGHAWGVFKPLHDAYERGRLEVGMLAIYADGRGRIRAYQVTEWRVVDPVEVHWAIASQPVPSMTLQTCVGPRGALRLNVRLVEVQL